jgi:hypothetical protein
MSNHARVKGWRFTFTVDDENWRGDPVVVLVEGEIGNFGQNTWVPGDPIYFANEDDAMRVARDVAWDYITDGEFFINRNQVQWIETADLHPDHYLGKKEVQQGVWL